jgi:hypothetical protein
VKALIPVYIARDIALTSKARPADDFIIMCRSIKILFNFEPPVTDDEIRAASLQFVRKISGFNSPSKANEQAFTGAVSEIEAAAAKLLKSLHTASPARNRAEEAAKAKSRAALRFSRVS